MHAAPVQQRGDHAACGPQLLQPPDALAQPHAELLRGCRQRVRNEGRGGAGLGGEWGWVERDRPQHTRGGWITAGSAGSACCVVPAGNSPPRARVRPPTWHAVWLAQQLPVHSHQLRGGGVQRVHCLRILQGRGNRGARVAGHSWVHASMREEPERRAEQQQQQGNSSGSSRLRMPGRAWGCKHHEARGPHLGLPLERLPHHVVGSAAGRQKVGQARAGCARISGGAGGKTPKQQAAAPNERSSSTFAELQASTTRPSMHTANNRTPAALAGRMVRTS